MNTMAVKFTSRKNHQAKTTLTIFTTNTLNLLYLFFHILYKTETVINHLGFSD